MGKKLTHEEFIERLKNVFGNEYNEYNILSKYQKSNLKIKMKHLKCGHEFEITPRELLHNNRKCPKCGMEKMLKNLAEVGRNHRKKADDFRKEFYALSNGNYELLSEYTGKTEKIKIKCNICGNIYSTRASVYLQGYRCPECARLKHIERVSKTRISHEQFLKECKENRDDLDEYIILGKYVNKRTKIRVKHISCR